MKKYHSILALAMMCVASMAITSCGDDDDDIVPPTPEVPTSVVLNATNFPDDLFRVYVEGLLSTPVGGVISAEALAQVTEIDVWNKGISSLKGIEYFTELTKLDCSHNNLTSLDISKNTKLKTLDCSTNKLASLNVSKNTALEALFCGENLLSALDVSQNKPLVTLGCAENKLTTLDVSNHDKLFSLTCADNGLTSLKVSGCKALKSLQCNDNSLTSIDASNLTSLSEFLCDNNKLTTLNVSGCTALNLLKVQLNQLKGTQMDAFITSLPSVSSGLLYVFDTSSSAEGNVCTVAQVNAAKGKGWTVRNQTGNNYAGS